jgi:hypothetical protein
MTDRRHREDYKLAVTDWPAADVAAWQKACHPLPGPFSAQPLRSPATYKKYADGYGIYLSNDIRNPSRSDTENPSTSATVTPRSVPVRVLP